MTGKLAAIRGCRDYEVGISYSGLCMKNATGSGGETDEGDLVYLEVTGRGGPA